MENAIDVVGKSSNVSCHTRESRAGKGNPGASIGLLILCELSRNCAMGRRSHYDIVRQVTIRTSVVCHECERVEAGDRGSTPHVCDNP
jgi:hypothetical protein